MALLTSLAGIHPAFAQCVPANCDDGDRCTADICFMNSCRHAVTLCDDGNPCTNDGCNPATGGCVHTAVVCGDNDVCTTDSCDPQIGCVHTPISCQTFACATTTCDPATGCVYTSNCDDGNACTFDACNTTTGSCEMTPLVCVDSDPCTYDLCDPAVGCRHPLNVKCQLVSQLALKMVGALSRTTFKRKGGTTESGPFVKVTFQDAVITSLDQKLVTTKVSVKVVLTGADAGIASLLYPVVALDIGAGAHDVLGARGYEFSVAGDVQPCRNQLPPETCSALAHQLSKAIDGALALDVAEQDAFRQGAQALGYPPDVCDRTP